MALLALGQWADGWPLYESRFAPGGFRAIHALQTREPVTMWTGQSLKGQTLYVFNEQGIGDTIMCLRYVRELASQAGRVVVRVPGNLQRLACASFQDLENVSIVGDGERVPAGAFVVPFMSLPLRVGGAPEGRPYLGIYPNDPPLFTHSGNACRIGVAWRGQAYPRNRSIPIAQLAPLFDIPGTSWFSLQVGDPAKDAAPFQQVHQTYLGDFYDTARLMRELDLIITIDSATAHLAGGLGVPCWTLLQFAADWRWGLGSQITPWYDRMILYRQAEPSEWPAVVDRIQHDLTQRVVARTMPVVTEALING